MRELFLPGIIVRAGAIAGLLATSVSLAPAQPRAAADRRLAEATRALSAGDRDRALQLGTAYLIQHPDDPRGRVLAARIHIDAGRFDAAYLEIRRALAAAPRDADALYYQALIAAQLAQEQFHRLETLAPQSPRLHQLLAESLEAQDRRQAAETEYQAALAARPDMLEALLGLAKLRRIRLACDDAIALYEKAEALRPTFDSAYGLGVCESARQDNDKALDWFERATVRDPRSAVAWVGLGTSLTRLHRPADAVVSLQRAIALEPAMAEAFYALGMAYQADNDKIKAAAAFRIAEALTGKDHP